MKFVDYDLARRIELADAEATRRCGKVLEKYHSEMGACTLDIGGGVAVYAGVGSPITQAIGVGMDGEVSEDDFIRMEQFFESRGARVEVECCPLSHASLRDLIDKRGYRVLEWSNVLFIRLSDASIATELQPGVEIRQATTDQSALWASVLTQGFAEEMGEAALSLMLVGDTLFKAASAGYLAYVDGVPAAGAAIFLHNTVASIQGASTMTKYRRRGIQSALIAARLNYAREQGCDLAYTITAPGSGSQRNVERAGYRIAYSRVKMHKPQS